MLSGGTSLMIPSTWPVSIPTWARRTSGGCDDWHLQSNYLKLFYDEGEIDFIAAPSITQLPTTAREIEGHLVALEHPVEVCVRKMFQRPRTLKAWTSPSSTSPCRRFSRRT